MPRKPTIAESAAALKQTNHRTAYAAAVHMVKKYQRLRTKTAKAIKAGEALPADTPEWPISFSFNKKGIQHLLKKTGCAGIRMYPAIHPEGQLTLVLVAFDENGNNLTPGAESLGGNLTAKALKGSDQPTLMAMSAPGEEITTDTGASDEDTLDESQVNPPFNSPTLP